MTTETYRCRRSFVSAPSPTAPTAVSYTHLRNIALKDVVVIFKKHIHKRAHIVIIGYDHGRVAKLQTVFSQKIVNIDIVAHGLKRDLQAVNRAHFARDPAAMYQQRRHDDDGVAADMLMTAVAYHAADYVLIQYDFQGRRIVQRHIVVAQNAASGQAIGHACGKRQRFV